MSADFQDYLEYNQNCNQLLIDNFLENTSIRTEKGINLLNHILNAHKIWTARILNLNEFEVWQINANNQLLNINSENYITNLRILDEKSPDQNIRYTNSKGNHFENPIREIFFHFIYHRGQLVMLTKTSGLEPINTDYIFYKRF